MSPMNQCHDSGTLRAYLDGELDPAEHLIVEAHIATCEACRTDLANVRTNATLVANLLAEPHISDPHTLLSHIYTAAQLRPSTPNRRKPMKPYLTRRWLAPLGAIVFALALLALPPLRAAADQVLQIFRVQTVMFVPVSQERMQQLQDLNFDGKSLFLAEPKFTNEDTQPRVVATSAEAAAAVGFALAEPTNLPGGVSETSYSVTDRKQAEFQVNVESARKLLQLTGVTDITLPDALGSRPITVDMAPAAMTHYRTNSATIDLIQGIAPQVSLPEGVALRDLGRAALRVLGMAPEQADALANQIDWSSTLVFPFPANLSSVRQVSINGAPGLLITAGGRGDHQASLYWQRGDRFYILQFDSSVRGEDQVPVVIQIAESVR